MLFSCLALCYRLVSNFDSDRITLQPTSNLRAVIWTSVRWVFIFIMRMDSITLSTQVGPTCLRSQTYFGGVILCPYQWGWRWCANEMCLGKKQFFLYLSAWCFESFYLGKEDYSKLNPELCVPVPFSVCQANVICLVREGHWGYRQLEKVGLMKLN